MHSLPFHSHIIMPESRNLSLCSIPPLCPQKTKLPSPGSQPADIYRTKILCMSWREKLSLFVVIYSLIWLIGSQHIQQDMCLTETAACSLCSLNMTKTDLKCKKRWGVSLGRCICIVRKHLFVNWPWPFFLQSSWPPPLSCAHTQMPHVADWPVHCCVAHSKPLC